MVVFAVASPGRVRGEPVRCWRGHEDEVGGLCASPDGQRLYSAAEDGWLRCWSLPDGVMLWERAGHGGAAVNDVACSPDGALVLSAGDDAEIGVWCALTGAPAGRLAGHRDVVSCVLAFREADSGELLAASSSRDRDVIVWSMGEGTPRHRLTGHEEWVSALAVSTDGQRLVSGSPDGALHQWSPATGEGRGCLAPASPARLRWLSPELFLGAADSAAVLAMVMLSDGRLVSASADGLRLWRRGRGRRQGGAPFPFTGQRPAALAALPGDGLVAAGERLELWTTARRGRRLAVSPSPRARALRAVVASPRGDLIYTADREGRLAAWSVADLLAEGAVAPAHEHGMRGAVAGPGWLASGERRRGRVRLWQVDSDGPRPLPHGEGADAWPLLALGGGEGLLTASAQAGAHRLWRWGADGKQRWEAALPGEALAAAPLGDADAAVLCPEALLKVDLATGGCVPWPGVVASHRACGALAVAKDWVVTAHRGAAPQVAAMLWRQFRMTRVGPLSVPAGASARLRLLRLSADGATILGWGDDGLLHTWRRRGRRHRAAWRPHPAAEDALGEGAARLTADGEVQTVSATGQLRDWSLEGRLLRQRQLPWPAPARAIRWADGGRLLSAVVGEAEAWVVDLRHEAAGRLPLSRPLAAAALTVNGEALALFSVSGEAEVRAVSTLLPAPARQGVSART